MTKKTAVLLLLFVCAIVYAGDKPKTSVSGDPHMYGNQRCDVTMSCCPVKIVSKDAAARYAGAQFGGNMKWRADGTAYVENNQLVIDLAPGAPPPPPGMVVDEKAELAPDVAAKLGIPAGKKLKQGVQVQIDNQRTTAHPERKSISIIFY